MQESQSVVHSHIMHYLLYHQEFFCIKLCGFYGNAVHSYTHKKWSLTTKDLNINTIF